MNRRKRRETAQRRRHVAGFRDRLAIDLPQHQHVVPGGMLADNLALEPGECLTQQG